MKKLILLSMLMATSTTFASQSLQYSSDDLSQLKETNECIDCDLSNASIINGNYSGANLQGSNLSNSDLNSDNFSESNFTYTDLTNSYLGGVNFSHADFTGAVLYQAYLRNANLYGAIISEEQLSQAENLCDAILPDGSMGAC